MKDPSASVHEKLLENTKQRESCRDLVCSGVAIAFVGAGLSQPLGYPTWDQLLKQLNEKANALSPFNPQRDPRKDPLEYADDIRNHFNENNRRNDYLNFLGRTFGPKKGPKTHTHAHSLLTSLPFRAFVTTNYDPSIESALAQSQRSQGSNLAPQNGVIIKPGRADGHQVSTFVRSIADPPAHAHPRVAYLHGRYDDTENIILTWTDYQKAYDGTSKRGDTQSNPLPVTRHRFLAWSLFATRRMVFFGFSMRDNYVRALLERVADDLWEWDDPPHFVVAPLDEEGLARTQQDEAHFQRYGLQVVYYDNQDGTHRNLESLLEEAAELARAASDNLQDPMKNRTTDASDLDRDQEIANSSLGPQKSANDRRWLQLMNARSLTSMRNHEN